ncbi:MAG TPA: helix-turn-helix transcriptional regulator [Candidatus Paceibacterota bacterium]|nr:helix-turn-helix transcriptional regulator [Candidatus Paceibacterota bacterium]
MPNIGIALRDEMVRIAKKANKSELQSLKKVHASHRHDIAQLKREIAELQKGLRRFSKAAGKPAPQHAETNPDANLRFSASRFASQRQKLGLSAADFAKLLGVSALSVYNWESGKSRPRRAQLELIAAARGLGKREAAVRLERLAA